MQTDRLHHAEGMDHKSQQFYASEVHHTAKMLLHNRDDLVNFAIAPGSGSNFQEKAVQLFFKVTTFQGLMQVYSPNNQYNKQQNLFFCHLLKE